DGELNEQTRVPEGHRLRVNVVWGVELYGPSEVDSLYAGLERLGWKSVTGADNLQKWIQHQRAFGFEASLNVGYVLDQADRGKSFLIHNYAKMPSGVSSMMVRCHQVSPSLTAVIVGFQLEESAARRYEEEINRDRVATLERGPGSMVSHLDSFHLKETSVKEVRSTLRRIADTWFRQNLPGFFSGLQRSGALPTMELLSARNCSVLQTYDKDQQPKSASFVGWRRLVSHTAPW